MIYQSFTLTRIFGIFVIQPILIIFFLSIAFRILYRNRNNLTLTLSTFYILSAAGFAINILFLISISLFPDLYILLMILYLTTSFLVIFSPIFILIFLIHLQKQLFKLWHQIFIISLYGVGCFIILILPDGISLGEFTNWIPIFSWNLLIFFYVYFTIGIFFPIFYLLIKIFKTFEDKSLRKKFIYFSIGILLLLVSVYGLVLYNTWQDTIFRSIWSLVSLIVIPSGLLIYYGIAQNL